MDQGPLVAEQVDAGARFAADFASNYMPLRAAFWLKGSEDGQWYLYLASDQIDDDNFDLAYGEVVRLMHANRYHGLDPFQIKVAGVDDPVVRGVLEVQRQHPDRTPTRVRDRLLGDLFVDEAYLYPAPVTATA